MISSVIFDLDGTLTNVPSPWQFVHERLGVWENTACYHLDHWLSGKISYEEFCQRDTSLWNGRSVDEIYSYLDEIEWNRHVPAVVEKLVAMRIPSVIISSGKLAPLFVVATGHTARGLLSKFQLCHRQVHRRY